MTEFRVSTGEYDLVCWTDIESPTGGLIRLNETWQAVAGFERQEFTEEHDEAVTDVILLNKSFLEHDVYKWLNSAYINIKGTLKAKTLQYNYKHNHNTVNVKIIATFEYGWVKSINKYEQEIVEIPTP